MSAHLTSTAREAYRDRRLGPKALLAVDAHLATCALCRGRLFAEGRWGTVFPALRDQLRPEARAHPAGADLSAYGDGEMDEAGRERIRAHLVVCARCRGEVKSLRRLARLLVEIVNRERTDESNAR